MNNERGEHIDGALAAWDGPAILLVDLDAFFASVEQLDHPAWRGKPVIVGGDAEKHGVVSTASYEARTFGVHSAMPASQACKLCPHAIWAPGRYDRYKEVSNQVMAILRDETPHVQQVSIDEAFLVVTPTRVNREHPVLVALRIQRRVEALGVTCSVGVGTSKTVAKIASDMDKPRGLTVVYPGTERQFLDPLPIRVMSGIGKATEEKLRHRGIETLGQLVLEGQPRLERLFGKNGCTMYVRACGLDDAPVVQGAPVKSVSNEVDVRERFNAAGGHRGRHTRRRRRWDGACAARGLRALPLGCGFAMPIARTARCSAGCKIPPMTSFRSRLCCAACLTSCGNPAWPCALSACR